MYSKYIASLTVAFTDYIFLTTMFIFEWFKLVFVLLFSAGGLSWEQIHTREHRTGSILEDTLIESIQIVLISTNEEPAVTFCPSLYL